MESSKICSEKLNAILNAFTWTRVDEDAPDSMHIYNAVMKSICNYTRRFQTDFLYDVLDITACVEQMKAHEELGVVSTIAIRECGVDGINFLYCWLKDFTSPDQVKKRYFDIFYLALELDEIDRKPRIVLYQAQLDAFRGLGLNASPRAKTLP